MVYEVYFKFTNGDAIFGRDVKLVENIKNYGIDGLRRIIKYSCNLGDVEVSEIEILGYSNLNIRN